MIQIQTVIKRQGHKAPFDISKIRKQIEFSCEGINLNPLELEANFSTALRNNITTKEIQELLIHTATSMVTPDNPDWIHSAGKLMMHHLHREVYKNTKIDYEEFGKYLDYAINNNYYRKDIKDKFTDDDIEILQRQVVKMIDTDFDKVLPQVLSLKSKYLIKNKRGLIEYPLFSDVASAMILGSIEVNP